MAPTLTSPGSAPSASHAAVRPTSNPRPANPPARPASAPPPHYTPILIPGT